MVLTAHLHDDVQDFTFLKTEVNKHLSYSEGSFLALRCCPPPPLLLCALKAGPDLEMNEVQVGHTTERTSIEDIWTVRLNVTVTRGSHHPALDHKAPPAVTPAQEPPCMAGETQIKQASSAQIPVPLTSGPGGPTGPGGPCQTEAWRQQLQEQPVLSVAYSANNFLSNTELGRVSWLPSCWPVHWALSRYICLHDVPGLHSSGGKETHFHPCHAHRGVKASSCCRQQAHRPCLMWLGIAPTIARGWMDAICWEDASTSASRLQTEMFSGSGWPLQRAAYP